MYLMSEGESVPDGRKAPVHWRQLAADARAAAELMLDPDARQELLKIAERYDLLAERAAAREQSPKQD